MSEETVEVQTEVELTPFQRVMQSIATSVDNKRGRTLDKDQVATLFEGYVHMARQLTSDAMSILALEEEVESLKKKGRLWKPR